MGLASEIRPSLSAGPAAIYRAAFDRSPMVRVLLRSHDEDPGSVHFDPLLRGVAPEPAPHTIPVHMTPDGEAAKKQTCPACGERDTIRFLGLAVASLASVSINTIFGSTHVEPEERKLLAFTDSVQDASHRASFFAGRSHRFNLRSLMSAALRDAGDEGISLADLGDLLMARGRQHPTPVTGSSRRTSPETEPSDRCGPIHPNRGRARCARTAGRVRGRSRVRAPVTGRSHPRTIGRRGRGIPWVDLDECADLALEAVARRAGRPA